MKTIILILFFLCFTHFSFCQTVPKENAYIVDKDKLTGTFQFEATDAKYLYVNLTYELLDKIQSARLPNDLTYLPINENCRVVVFPFSQIDSLRKFPPAEYRIISAIPVNHQ